MTRKQTTIATVALLIAAILAFIVAGTPTANAPGDGQGQRSGLVATAYMSEGTHYSTGAEYVQAVYASQGIEVSTDLLADTYTATVPAHGDVVIGNGYVGVLVDDTTAIGVAEEGGPVQTYRVTTEDIRRVDW